MRLEWTVAAQVIGDGIAQAAGLVEARVVEHVTGTNQMTARCAGSAKPVNSPRTVSVSASYIITIEYNTDAQARQTQVGPTHLANRQRDLQRSAIRGRISSAEAT
jgi:predicted urease superfamily metal-dependent hydrolase